MMKIDSNIDKDSLKYRQYRIKMVSIIKIIAFLTVICVGAVISLILPLRPTVSTNENRVLTSFPEFQLTAFLEGDYFKQIDTWFSDTFPFRDTLISCNEELSSFYGIRTTSLHGEVVAGDEIPDVDLDFEGTNQLQNSVDVTSLEQGSEPREGTDAHGNSTGQVSSTADLTGELEMDIEADEIGTHVDVSDTADATEEAKTGERLDSIFVVGDSAYNYYAFSQSCSDTYAAVLNQLADHLQGSAEVYDMIVPTSIDIALDDATRNSLSSSNQKKAMLYMYSNMNDNVHKTYIYEVMRSHRNEYLYYRTDHHWTSLGAYYAYASFMNQLGVTPHALSEYEKVQFTGFKGSFFTQSGATSLNSNPDTVDAYIPLSTNKMQIENTEGGLVDYNIITDVSEWSSSSKYSTFIGGDNAFAQIHNPQLTDGSKILVVKESFGNAFAPYLTDHFEDVYVIDYRYYEGTVSELVAQYGIDKVIVLNNISATSTSARVQEMQQVMQ